MGVVLVVRCYTAPGYQSFQMSACPIASLTPFDSRIETKFDEQPSLWRLNFAGPCTGSLGGRSTPGSQTGLCSVGDRFICMARLFPRLTQESELPHSLPSSHFNSFVSVICALMWLSLAHNPFQKVILHYIAS